MPAARRRPRMPRSARLPTRQRRSARTADRVLAAAADLLRKRPFESLSVSEIAARAGVSVGGLYARFAGKLALLGALDEEFVAGMLATFDARFSPERLAGMDARARIRAYIELAVDAFTRHRALLREVARWSRVSPDQAFRERVRRVNRHLHDRFRAALRERRAEMAHPNPPAAIDLALVAVSAAMRETLLFSDSRPGFHRPRPAELVNELTHMFASYVGLPPVTRSRP